MYKEEEKLRLASNMVRIFNDPGEGYYGKKSYKFVLSNPELNLWHGIRQEAINYFNKYNISWHKGTKGIPSGHVLSSQVACVNHLFILRNNQKLATAVLKHIESDIVEAEVVDDGYVEFEFIGKHGIGEGAFKRGANCTSVDAAMIGKTAEGKRILFFIEWKYTESYSKKSLQCPKREVVYNKLIVAKDTPFSATNDLSIYYYEPFYQMMRQTLLADLCVKNREYGCEDYRIVHVIPEGNIKLRNTITSPGMSGATICDAWKKVIKRPDTYISTTPEALMSPIKNQSNAIPLIAYLAERYR